jgi:DNA-binding NarL/FixJ family response regulator
MVIQVIRLVLAGGTFIPPGVLEAGEASDDSGDSQEFEPGPRRYLAELTPRQGEVFELLRQGKSNKLIAYELGMQESTVKVHVRQIMRKLKAINRTHAVFLAEAIVNGEAN